MKMWIFISERACHSAVNIVVNTRYHVAVNRRKMISSKSSENISKIAYDSFSKAHQKSIFFPIFFYMKTTMSSKFHFGWRQFWKTVTLATMMTETKNVGDNIDILITVSAFLVTNIQKLSSTLSDKYHVVTNLIVTINWATAILDVKHNGFR